MKLVKLIANLGYGSRKEVAAMFREGRITDASGEVLYADDRVEHAAIRIDGEPLDPPQGLLLMLHKPTGYTCSTKDAGHIVYELVPPRFLYRSPVVSTVGRLDRDTSGLLLMTDDGVLLHRIVRAICAATRWRFSRAGSSGSNRRRRRLRLRTSRSWTRGMRV
jgi:16S rRNA pseudouridine516 synthase